MTDPHEIQSFDVIKWRTLGSIASSTFKSLIHKELFPSNFDGDFARQIGDRWRELQRTNYKISFLLFSMILLLGAINSDWLHEVEFLGINLSKENSAVSVLILFSAILILATSILSLMSGHYEKLLKAYIEATQNQQFAEYYMLQYGWRLETLFSYQKNSDENINPSVVVVFFTFLWLIAGILALIILGLLQLFLFVGAIISIIDASGIPAFINNSIIAVAICTISFHLVSLLLQLPLPHLDSSNIKILNELEESDPEQAEEIRTRIATRSLQKERRNVALLQIVLFLVSLISPYLLLFGLDFFSHYLAFSEIILGLLVFSTFGSSLLDRYERYVILKERQISDDESRVTQYIKDKKKILLVRLTFSLIFGIVTFLYFRWGMLV